MSEQHKTSESVQNKGITMTIQLYMRRAVVIHADVELVRLQPVNVAGLAMMAAYGPSEIDSGVYESARGLRRVRRRTAWRQHAGRHFGRSMRESRRSRRARLGCKSRALRAGIRYRDSVVVSTSEDSNPILVHLVDEPVLVIDSSRPTTLQLMLQWLGFSDPRKRITLNLAN